MQKKIPLKFNLFTISLHSSNYDYKSCNVNLVSEKNGCGKIQASCVLKPKYEVEKIEIDQKPFLEIHEGVKIIPKVSIKTQDAKFWGRRFYWESDYFKLNPDGIFKIITGENMYDSYMLIGARYYAYNSDGSGTSATAGFWIPSQTVAIPDNWFWQPPNIETKINNSKKQYSNGWVKIDGQLKEIDKIWTKINGNLKEV